MRRWGLVALLWLLLASETHARPGGGSSFRGSSSGSSRGSSSSSSSSSYSSHSEPSEHSNSSGATYDRPAPSRPKVVEEDFSYMIRRPQDRQDQIATWAVGKLGPFGAGPKRPTKFDIQQVKEMRTGEALAWLGGILIFGLLLVIFVLRLIVRFVRRKASGWTTAIEKAVDGVASSLIAKTAAPVSVRKQIESIRELDTDFSVVLLEDFLYALYAEAQTARGQGATARLAPYLRATARAHLDSLGAKEVRGIVVGAMRLVSFSAQPRLGIEVEIEANYAEKREHADQGFYTREQWSISRSRAARSRPPERVRVLGCPSCGAPLDRMVGGICQYCNRVVDGGNDDWIVEKIALVERVSRGPMLTGTVEEAGTELPTVFDPELPQELDSLRGRDPAFEEENIRARVQRIFHVMQEAWSSLHWENARPFLSDNLFEAQSYWMAAYRNQGLRNITENAQATSIEIVRITQDRWYCALTVRLHASSLDYTIRESDKRIVAGSKTRTRRYTEYWTLIRGTGRTGQAHADMVCPSCGAPLEISMAALCKYCQAKVNSGEFDWVLSRIEQDEVYAG